MKTIRKTIAIKILSQHGFTPTQQTACFKSQIVKSGSSFYENVGDKSIYTVQEVKNWLGY